MISELRQLRLDFAQACDLSSPARVPSGLSRLLNYLEELCQERGLIWNLGPGKECPFSCILVGNEYQEQVQWFVEAEDPDPTIAILRAVSVAWRVKLGPSTKGNIVNLNDWRIKNGR